MNKMKNIYFVAITMCTLFFVAPSLTLADEIKLIGSGDTLQVTDRNGKTLYQSDYKLLIDGDLSTGYTFGKVTTDRGSIYVRWTPQKDVFVEKAMINAKSINSGTVSFGALETSWGMSFHTGETQYLNINKIGKKGQEINISMSYVGSGVYNLTNFNLNEINLIGYVIENPVTNVNVVPSYDSAEITFKKPQGVTDSEIYLGDQLVYTGDVEKYKFSGLEPEKTYKYKIKSLYEGNGRGGYEGTFKTLEAPTGVKSVTVTPSFFEAIVKYTNPSHSSFTENKIYLNNKVVYEGGKTSNFTFTNLQDNTKYEYQIDAVFTNGSSIAYNGTFTTKEDNTPINDVTDLKAKQTADKKVKVTYSLPTKATGVKIYRDGLLIKEQSATEYIDDSVQLNETYTYKVVAVYTKGQAPGVSVNLKVSSMEVSQLTAKSTQSDISLMWSNPLQEDFKKVKIYRKAEGGIVRAVLSLFNSDIGYEELFETNGTEFKDLTVQADKEYTYKLTSFIGSTETEGTEVKVKTPKASVIGGDVKPPTGKSEDYTVNWQQPTTGKIKVVVGGNEYKIVPAENLTMTIPKKDMKYDVLGNPEVELIPVNEDGNEGIPTKPNGTSGGNDVIKDVTMNGELTPKNLLKAGIGLLAAVGGFVLLALAFAMSPKLMQVIRGAFEKRGTKDV